MVASEEARGGGIYNAGTLTLERSTVSGNQSEYYGGALYTRGQGESAKSLVTIMGSTVAFNSADKLPAQHVVTVSDTPAFDPPDLLTGVISGDYVQFKSSGLGYTLLVEGNCNADKIEVPPFGGGLSQDLICTASDHSETVRVSISGYERADLHITVAPPGYTAEAQALYVGEYSDATLARTIVVHRKDVGDNCKYGTDATITSLGDNVTDDSIVQPLHAERGRRLELRAGRGGAGRLAGRAAGQQPDRLRAPVGLGHHLFACAAPEQPGHRSGFARSLWGLLADHDRAVIDEPRRDGLGGRRRTVAQRRCDGSDGIAE